MEAKKFISTLKGFKTRFTKTPNTELELKSVKSLTEKFGGQDNAVEALNADADLKTYYMNVMGITPKKSSAKKTKKSETKKEETPTEERFEVVTGKNGKTYKVDKIKKTCKRVFKDFSELAALELPEMDMQVYQRYLRDNFPGEDMPIKKGKLHFRGYRISCTIDSGFVIEDTTKKYAVVDTPWEGIPTPREFGDFFKRPTREFSQEEMKKAVELGKELAEKSKEKNEEVGLEALREKVLELLKGVRLGHVTDFDPATLPSMIPFKRWQKQIKSLLSQWKERKIRYPKFLAEVERITTEETFEAKEKKVVVKFSGTCLPDFVKVGRLVGDKLEVDDKMVDAVPFMLDYILHYEPKAMQQIMRYAKGECTDVFLLKNPYHKDNTIEFEKKALENTPSNAQLLTALCASIGLVAPQDLLYEADLEVGDKILIDIDGEWKTKQIMGKEKGFTMSKEVGLLKLDKWIKLPKGE